jgi:hypothetical protein
MSVTTNPVSRNIDLTQTQDLVNCRDYDAILQSKERFWAQFCMAHAQTNMKEQYCFKTKIETESIKVIGREHIVKNMADTVDEIRKLLLEKHEKKENCSIAPIKIVKLHFKSESKVIDLSDELPDSPKIFESWYNAHIKPTWQNLASSLGATVSFQEKMQMYIDHDHKLQNQNITLVKINWNRDAHYIFPILPLPLEALPPLDVATCRELFKNKIGCDLVLKDKDGYSISMHSLILLLRGGTALTSTLTSKMKEGESKTISFDFDKTVLHAFTDYLYSPSPGEFLEQFVREPTCDWFELLAFAHTFQVPRLVDCMTNVISLLDPEEHLEKIKAAADRYENSQLQKLVEHLESEKTAISAAAATCSRMDEG